MTFGLSYLILELVQLVWGVRPYPWPARAVAGAAFSPSTAHSFPKSRSFHHAGRTGHAGIGVAAADAHAHRPGHPGRLRTTRDGQSLGHKPRVFALVFGGGCALAGLAGVIGGNTYVTEPAMAGSVGSIIFVLVGGARAAWDRSRGLSGLLLIGLVQTFAWPWTSRWPRPATTGMTVTEETFGWPLPKLTISQVAPIPLQIPASGIDPDLPPQGPVGRRRDHDNDHLPPLRYHRFKPWNVGRIVI